MTISEFIRELKKAQKANGDVELFARDRENTLRSVIGTDVVFGIKGNTRFEHLYVMTEQSQE